jgi:hypothetical protein
MYPEGFRVEEFAKKAKLLTTNNMMLCNIAFRLLECYSSNYEQFFKPIIID